MLINPIIFYKINGNFDSQAPIVLLHHFCQHKFYKTNFNSGYYHCITERPRRVAPTCLLSSLRGKFRSSKRPSVSWMLIRTVSCPPRTSSPPSTPWVNPFPTVKPKACLAKPQAQSISHKWSCFSQKRWPEVSFVNVTIVACPT